MSADNATGVGIKYVRAPVAVATSDAEDYVPPVDLPNAVVDAVAHHANYWPLTHGAIGKSFYRFAQELKDEVIARLPPHCFTKPTPAALPIDFKQATELLAMFGGEPGEVTLLTGEGHSGRGLYAHYSEYPEEGAEFLGVADDEAMPGKQATDQGGWLPLSTAPDGIRVLLGPREAPVVGIVRQMPEWADEQEPVASVLHYNGTVLVAGYHCSEWHSLPGTAPRPESELTEALGSFLEAQDALDNREYAGINGESYEVLMRRRNAARRDLDRAMAAAPTLLGVADGDAREQNVEAFLRLMASKPGTVIRSSRDLDPQSIVVARAASRWLALRDGLGFAIMDESVRQASEDEPATPSGGRDQ